MPTALDVEPEGKVDRDLERSILETVAAQMEIGAELSFGYLNFSTGTVRRVTEFDADSEYRRLMDSGFRYMIPNITSQDLYLWMVEFAEGVEDPSLRQELRTSLQGVSAVWKFRNVLYHREEASRDWERFKHGKLLAEAGSWIEYLKKEVRRMPRP